MVRVQLSPHLFRKPISQSICLCLYPQPCSHSTVELTEWSIFLILPDPAIVKVEQELPYINNLLEVTSIARDQVHTTLHNLLEIPIVKGFYTL